MKQPCFLRGERGDNSIIMEKTILIKHRRWEATNLAVNPGGTIQALNNSK